MDLRECCKALRDIEDNYLYPRCPIVQRDPAGVHIAHLRWMIYQILDNPEFTENKAMRWLGYIQGVMVAQGIVSLEQMKELSRKAVND